jgi:hypothetical protein
MAFGLLRVWMIILRAAVSVAIVVVITIYLKVRRLRLLLLLVTLRRRSLGFLVAEITESFVLDLTSLPVGRTPPVQRSGFAVSTIVFELIIQGLLSSTGIEALDVLPCAAGFAENCTSIVVVVATNALDGRVVYGLGRRRRIVGRDRSRRIEGGLNRSRDLRGN